MTSRERRLGLPCKDCRKGVRHGLRRHNLPVDFSAYWVVSTVVTGRGDTRWRGNHRQGRSKVASRVNAQHQCEARGIDFGVAVVDI